MSIETVYSPQIEFRASESLERRRIVDYYSYLIRNGKLYSPSTGSPVEDSITTRDSLEDVELSAFKGIQNWAVFSVKGSCVWISPPARFDLSAKAVISEIVDDPQDGKILVNRNICFDWYPNMFLQFAAYTERNDIKNGEDLRGKPIFLLPKDHDKLLELIEEIEPLQVKQIKTGADIRIKEETKALIARGEMVPSGQYSPSCAGSAFEVFSGLVDKYGSREFRCPHCNKINTRPPGQLISNCQHCGGDVRC